VRARKAAAQRTQKFVFGACTLVLFISVAAGIAFGAKTVLNRLFFANKDFAIRSVEVTVDGDLTRETVLRTAQVEEGMNIFSIDLAHLRRQLAALPQVEESYIERILPDRLAIRIQERRPVAWLVPPQTNPADFNFENGFLVDRRGILLKTTSLAPEYLGLPLIVGVDVANYVPGQPVDLAEVKAALELIRASSEILKARFQIQSVDVSRGYCLVVTDKQRASITFGSERIEWQLHRLESLFNYCDQNKRELQTVNLMVQRNVPVTFVPLPEPQSADEQPVPPQDAEEPKANEKKSQTKPELRKPRSGIEERVPKVRRARPVEKRLNG
jgi:cell division septal protein FtsQ